MAKTEIAVIGAGIGGMTFALAALRRGMRVRVYEQAPKITVVGGGISIAPNSLKVLHALGLKDSLEAVACYPKSGTIRDGNDGSVVASTSFEGYDEEYGAPYMQIHRADLHAALLNAAQEIDPEVLSLGKSMTGLAMHHAGVEIAFADGGQAHADVLVGADGLKSSVRSALFGERGARYTGVVAWRGTVNMDALPEDSRIFDSNVWVGTNRTIVQHPVCSGTVMHVSGLAADQPWSEEGWTIRSSVDEAINAFAGFDPRVLTILGSIPPDQCFKWALHDRDPLPTWTKGRAVLLGDAAHAMLPFLAQGAAQAIEDAWVLAAALDGGFTSIEDALVSYVAIRHQRATYVQLGARAAKDRIAGYGVKESILPEKGSILQPETLFGWDPNAITDQLRQFDAARFETAGVSAG